MGFCISGHMTYLTAAETDVAAAASFYGGGIAAPQGPGGKDSMILQSEVAAIRSALEEHSVRHEIVVYEGADHGVFCDQRVTYHEASAKDAWAARVKKLFAEELRD